jgi:hypothetical protein
MYGAATRERTINMKRLLRISIYLSLMLAICVGNLTCASVSRALPTLTAITSSSKSYTAADLFGIWHLDKADTLITFHEDGSYVRDAGGQLLTKPGSFGTYSVNGTQLTFHVTSDACPSPGQYACELEIPEDGHLTFVVMEDTTIPAGGLSGEWYRTRVDACNLEKYS